MIKSILVVIAIAGSLGLTACNNKNDNKETVAKKTGSKKSASGGSEKSDDKRTEDKGSADPKGSVSDSLNGKTTPKEDNKQVVENQISEDDHLNPEEAKRKLEDQLKQKNMELNVLMSEIETAKKNKESYAKSKKSFDEKIKKLENEKKELEDQLKKLNSGVSSNPASNPAQNTNPADKPSDAAAASGKAGPGDSVSSIPNDSENEIDAASLLKNPGVYLQKFNTKFYQFYTYVYNQKNEIINDVNIQKLFTGYTDFNRDLKLNINNNNKKINWASEKLGQSIKNYISIAANNLKLIHNVVKDSADEATKKLWKELLESWVPVYKQFVLMEIKTEKLIQTPSLIQNHKEGYILSLEKQLENFEKSFKKLSFEGNNHLTHLEELSKFRSDLKESIKNDKNENKDEIKIILSKIIQELILMDQKYLESNLQIDANRNMALKLKSWIQNFEISLKTGDKLISLDEK